MKASQPWSVLYTVTFTSFATLGLMACAPENPLEPAAAAPKSPLFEDAVMAFVEEVQVTAQVNHWPGAPGIREHVTPVRVWIDNDSDRPVRVRYEDFSLVSKDGRTYKALPLYKIEGDVRKPITVTSLDPVEIPGFQYRGFAVAPHARVMYRLPVYRGPFYYDPSYYGTYYSYWAELPLPTAEMANRALPEGVISPGGELDGYLYFQRVPKEKRRVELRADLTDAETSSQFGMAILPFKVEG